MQTTEFKRSSSNLTPIQMKNLATLIVFFDTIIKVNNTKNCGEKIPDEINSIKTEKWNQIENDCLGNGFKNSLLY